MNHPSVEHISACFIKPKHSVEGSKQHIYLSPWDLAMPSVHYIQKGLLFLKPKTVGNQAFSIAHLLQKLKDSLSLALTPFYPLAGRLATLKTRDPHCYTIYIDCENSPGARFIHADLNLTTSDILTPGDVPVVVQSLFDHDRAINHDGHVMSLLSVQVTELLDGVFIGCSINHMVVDGESFWHFLNSWSEIFNEKTPISRPPILNRFIPDGHGPILSLPYTQHDQFLSRHEAPPLRERIFHLSSNSISKLKQKANLENKNSIKISSLQAVSALVWRSITRARNSPCNQQTHCRLAVNNRSRLVPRVPEDYFGNCIQTIRGTAKAGELLSAPLGYAARLLNRAVADHDDVAVRGFLSGWVKDPFIYNLGQFFDPNSVMMGSSPRFQMYRCEFGLGKAVAVRSGYANKFDGKVTLYQAADGGGGMDLEVCLSPDNMAAIVRDAEFVDALTCQRQLE